MINVTYILFHPNTLLYFYLRAPFGTKEKRRKSEGFSSIGKEWRWHVWIKGFGGKLSRGKAIEIVLLKERKNVLRAKGNFPTTLARSRSTLLLVISRVFPVLWIPAFQTPLLVISRVFSILYFTTTHSPHSCVFFLFPCFWFLHSKQAPNIYTG